MCRSKVGFLILGLLVGLSVGGARGELPCGDYENSARFLSRLYLGDDLPVHSLIAEGTLLYSQSASRIVVSDISDPIHPQTVAHHMECGGSYFAKEDSLVVFATAEDAVVSWDFRLPLNPAPRDTLGDGFFAPLDIANIEMAGTCAFVATRTQGVVILELAGPEGMVVVGNWDHPETVNDIAVWGDTGYAVSAKGLSVLDLSDPGHPVAVRGLDAPARWAMVEEGLLLVGNDLVTEVYSLEDPRQPVKIYRREHAYQEFVALGRGLVAGVDSPYTTVLEPIRALGQEDASLTLGSSWNGWGPVVIHDQLVIKASGSTLAFYEHEEARRVEGSVPQEAPGYITDLACQADLVYWLIDEPGGRRLEIRRLLEDGTLMPVGELGGFGYLDGLALEMDVAVLYGNHILHLVDVSDPAGPVLMATQEVPEGVVEVAVEGEKLVVVAYEEILLFDVGNLAQPVLLDRHSFHLGRHLALDEGVVGLSGPHGWYGLYLFSVAHGTIEPQGTVPLESAIENLSVLGGLAFAQRGYHQHEIYDISDPMDPVLLNSTATWALGPGVLLEGQALIGDGYNLRFYDLAPDYSLAPVGCFWFAGLQGIEPLDDGRVLLWSHWRTQVAPSPCHWVSPYPPAGHAEPAAHLEAGPNPLNPQTTIRFEMPAGGFCRLAIHDVQGRRVRTLCSDNLAAGPQEMVWKGRDDAGRALPSGMYFARLENAAGVASCKLVLLK